MQREMDTTTHNAKEEGSKRIWIESRFVIDFGEVKSFREAFVPYPLFSDVVLEFDLERTNERTNKRTNFLLLMVGEFQHQPTASIISYHRNIASRSALD